MDNNNENNGFQYTYSAREQAELKKIREKYIAPAETEDKMDRLRRLDASVTRSAQTVALVFGVIGTLLLGFGMSLVMTDIGEMVGITADNMVLGIIIGVVGLTVAVVNYPIYKGILNSRRKKYAVRILELSEKVMNK